MDDFNCVIIITEGFSPCPRCGLIMRDWFGWPARKRKIIHFFFKPLLSGKREVRGAAALVPLSLYVHMYMYIRIYMCSACDYPTNYSYELTNTPAAQLAV